jgi:hypothetical protein
MRIWFLIKYRKNVPSLVVYNIAVIKLFVNHEKLIVTIKISNIPNHANIKLIYISYLAFQGKIQKTTV